MLDRLPDSAQIVDADAAYIGARWNNIYKDQWNIAGFEMLERTSSIPNVMIATPSTRRSIMRRTELFMCSRSFIVDARRIS